MDGLGPGPRSSDIQQEGRDVGSQQTSGLHGAARVNQHAPRLTSPVGVFVALQGFGPVALKEQKLD